MSVYYILEILNMFVRNILPGSLGNKMSHMMF